jgi:hypothetical protein
MHSRDVAYVLGNRGLAAIRLLVTLYDTDLSSFLSPQSKTHHTRARKENKNKNQPVPPKMPKFYSSIPPNLADWAVSQPVFFVASAPLLGRHVNVSPKGLPSSTFTIFDANHAAYVDATGSGNETISHVYENGRVTVMFCSFDATPRILRLFCTGTVVEWDMPDFGPTLERMGKKGMEGARAVFLLDVWKVSLKRGRKSHCHPQKTPRNHLPLPLKQPPPKKPGPNLLRLRRPARLPFHLHHNLPRPRHARPLRGHQVREQRHGVVPGRMERREPRRAAWPARRDEGARHADLVGVFPGVGEAPGGAAGGVCVGVLCRDGCCSADHRYRDECRMLQPWYGCRGNAKLALGTAKERGILLWMAELWKA